MQKQSAMLDREHAILVATKRDGTKDGRKYYFVICDICFWCASLIEPDLSNYHGAFSYPICKGSKVQAIPLASDEV